VQSVTLTRTAAVKSFLRACCAAATALALSVPTSAATLSFDELGSAGGVFGTGGLDGTYQGFDLSPGTTNGWLLADPLGTGLGITLQGGGFGSIVGARIGGSSAFTFSQARFLASSIPASGTTLPVFIQLVGTDGSSIWLGDATGIAGPATLTLSSGDGLEKIFVNPLPATEIAQMFIYGRPGSFIVDDIALLYPYGSGGSGGGTGGGTGGSGSGGSGSGSGTGGTGGLPLGGGGGIVTPIPEPSTYAMLLAGLGCIVLVARRRQMQG
jgi:hypothetical protein